MHDLSDLSECDLSGLHDLGRQDCGYRAAGRAGAVALQGPVHPQTRPLNKQAAHYEPALALMRAPAIPLVNAAGTSGSRPAAWCSPTRAGCW